MVSTSSNELHTSAVHEWKYSTFSCTKPSCSVQKQYCECCTMGWFYPDAYDDFNVIPELTGTLREGTRTNVWGNLRLNINFNSSIYKTFNIFDKRSQIYLTNTSVTRVWFGDKAQVVIILVTDSWLHFHRRSIPSNIWSCQPPILQVYSIRVKMVDIFAIVKGQV